MKLRLLFLVLMAGSFSTLPLPASASFNSLGGAKENYSPAIDPRTDTTAEQSNAVKLLTAQMSRTAVRALVAFECDASPADPELLKFRSVWGVSPAPTIARVPPSDGHYRITFPSSVTIEGQNVGVNMEFAQASITRVDWLAHAEIIAPNVIDIRTLQSGGSPDDPLAGATITVSVY